MRTAGLGLTHVSEYLKRTTFARGGKAQNSAKHCVCLVLFRRGFGSFGVAFEARAGLLQGRLDHLNYFKIKEVNNCLYLIWVISIFLCVCLHLNLSLIHIYIYIQLLFYKHTHKAG